MVRFAAVAVAALVAAPHTLSYRPAPGPPRAIEGEMSYDFEITGPDSLVQQLVASNPVLSVQQVRASRRGTLQTSSAVGNTTRVRMLFDTGNVKGIANGKPFTFDFARKSPPASMEVRRNPAQVVSWGQAMARRDYLISPTGEFTLIDPSLDAQAEASAVLLDGAVRLPQKPVEVGDSWNSEWAGKRTQKDNGGNFSFKQTARLEDVTSGSSPQARISFTTTGTFNIPADKNPRGEVTTLEGKGYILLDITTGVIVGSDTSGAISTELKKAGVKLVRRMSAKFKVQ